MSEVMTGRWGQGEEKVGTRGGGRWGQGEEKVGTRGGLRAMMKEEERHQMEDMVVNEGEAMITQKLETINHGGNGQGFS